MPTTSIKILPNATYNKIKDVLIIIQQFSNISLDALIDEIIKRKLDSFCYWTPKSTLGERKKISGLITIRKNITFIQTLGLISIEDKDSTCKLTDIGINALIENRFDSTISKCVNDYLLTFGYAYDVIKKSLQKCGLPEFPTIDFIYFNIPGLSEKISETSFRRLINLLINSKTIDSKFKRLLIPT